VRTPLLAATGQVHARGRAAPAFLSADNEEDASTSQAVVRGNLESSRSSYRPGRAQTSRTRLQKQISEQRRAATLVEQAVRHEGEKSPENSKNTAKEPPLEEKPKNYRLNTLRK